MYKIRKRDQHNCKFEFPIDNLRVQWKNYIEFSLKEFAQGLNLEKVQLPF
jgi:hypothetical protein